MEKTYYTTIGLEIHAELKTQTKMFCNSKNDPDEEKPNVNICPVCMGHPGTLPVINKQAVKHVLKVGAAVGGHLADFTEFDRKNYFYPDIPKGYQISQYKYPLITGGSLNGVELTRVHLEEDTATSKHLSAQTFSNEKVSADEKGDYSLVDFNRAGVPLMELVTEPVIKSAEEAASFAKELQLLLRTLGVSDANMEKGEMRVEANISISEDPNVFGTKVEVKNLNSFKSVERAIAYELIRHQSVIESGEKVAQETRGFDENTGKTFSQRSKEDSHDYRYFPDPDLPKLFISKIPEFSIENLKKEIPELPSEKRIRLEKFGIKKEDIEVYVQNQSLGEFFERSIEKFSEDKESVRLASNYIVSDLSGLMKNTSLNQSEGLVGRTSYKDVLGKISPSSFGKLIGLLREGKLSSRGAKDTLTILFTEGGEPEKIAEEKGWIIKNDPEALKAILLEVIQKNPAPVAEYKSGKENALNSLIGQGMKASKGSGSPQAIKEILISLLS